MTTTAVPIHVLDADSTRAEVEEAVRYANAAAIRVPHVTAKLSTSRPTAWDICHQRINEYLDQRDKAPCD